MVILNMMENLLMINLKEMENIFIFYMVKAYIIMKTGKFVMKVNLLKINTKETEGLIMQMVNMI